MSTLELKELSHPSGEVIKIAAGKTLDLKSQGSVTMPTGSVLQVVSTTVSGTASASGYSNVSSGNGADLGLKTTITPFASGSSFYISVDIGIGSTTSGNTWVGVLSRDSTRIGNGPDASPNLGVMFRGIDHTGGSGSDTNHGLGASGSYLDTSGSTAGTATEFFIGFYAESGAVKINEVESNYSGGGNTPAATRTQSTITIMEIQG